MEQNKKIQKNLFENNLLNSRFKQLNIHGVERCGITYFNKSECKNVIQFCKENGIAVLGIDGFEFQGDFIVDLMDIYDASCLPQDKWDDFVNKSINGAFLFISQNNKKNEFFEFVFFESTEARKTYKKENE